VCTVPASIILVLSCVSPPLGGCGILAENELTLQEEIYFVEIEVNVLFVTDGVIEVFRRS
jgi:hypothetical protein